jgi:predicted Ser/Thr protein kinase
MLDRICPQCGMRTQEPTCPTHHCPTVVQVTGGLDSLPHGCVVGGRYRIERQIGKGGFGAVYLASHLATKQELVLKVLKPDLSEDPTQVQRFFNEARASSLLSHPNTVRVFDFGQTDVGLLYIAMERLHGKELAHALREGGGRLSALRAVRIAIGVLKSLAEAHHAGLVHRDLKPDNVFLCRVHGEDEFVKVIDFGIAKPKDSGEQNLTRTGFTVGTPKYMSPEQVLNKPLDGRSDLYALGVILYQCLAGEVPLVGASPMETLMAHLQQEPLDLRQRAPDVPVALAKLVMRALRKNPWERFTDADDMREALEPSPDVAGGRRSGAAGQDLAAHGRGHGGRFGRCRTCRCGCRSRIGVCQHGRAAILRGVLVTTEREVPTTASQETAGPAEATAVLRTPAGRPVAERPTCSPPEVAADDPAVRAAQNETTLLSTARHVVSTPPGRLQPPRRSETLRPRRAGPGRPVAS